MLVNDSNGNGEPDCRVQGDSPGKSVPTRGLRRLMDMVATQAFLDHYREEQVALSFRIAAWIGQPSPGEL